MTDLGSDEVTKPRLVCLNILERRKHTICDFLDPFWGPCLLDGGLRSRLPNGSEISRAGEDAPHCGSATGSPGRPLRENFSLRSLLSDQKEPDSWVCFWPDDTSVSLHQKKGSINNFLVRGKNLGPGTASMDRVDFPWQDRYDSRQYLIGFLALRNKSRHREPTRTARGDK